MSGVTVSRDGVVTGNTFDKYGSTNPVVRRLMAGFEQALDRLFDQAPHWWYVGGLYCLAAGIIFVVVVAASRVGPHGAACWRDLRVIASRFLPVKAT